MAAAICIEEEKTGKGSALASSGLYIKKAKMSLEINPLPADFILFYWLN